FIGLIFAAATFGYQTPSAEQRLSLAKPDVAVERVKRCGFRDVRARFDNDLQEEVVEVGNISAVSAEQLRCTARASLSTIYYVTFPASIMDAYWKVYW